MSPTPVVVVDGLLRALCPSIDAIVSSSYATTRFRPRTPQQRQQQKSPTTSQPLAFPQHAARRNVNNTHALRLGCQVRHTHGSAAAPADTDTGYPLNTTTGTTTPESNNAPATLAERYETLRKLRDQPGGGRAIRKHVQTLVNTMGEKPNIFIYEALAAANWETNGSAEELELILQSSRESQVPRSERLYHDALRVLAIHPDYVLRVAILKDMYENKISLTSAGVFSRALGYLRDGQYEMALEYLETKLLRLKKVPSWVWDIFIYNLGSQGFVDESFRLLQQRIRLTGNNGASIRPVVWSFMLEECSKALHYEGTKFVWDLLVEPANALNPSDGTILNVLNTAARHKDPALATQAIQRLSSKGIKLGLQHYEPLLDCYAYSGDLESALRVLCIMNDAGLQTDPASTRSLYITLRQSPDLLAKGPEILRSLNDTHKDIPTSAMNVLIEALPNGQWDSAVEMYQQLRHLCRLGPNKRTFDLLREKATSAEEIRFVVTELYMSGLRRDWSMYDTLVYAYTLDEKLDDAFRFLKKITSQESKIEEAKADNNKNNNNSSVANPEKRYWIRQRTFFALLECCFKHADERAWWLIDEAKGRGIEISRQQILKWVELARQMEKEREQEENQGDQLEQEQGEKVIS